MGRMISQRTDQIPKQTSYLIEERFVRIHWFSNGIFLCEFLNTIGRHEDGLFSPLTNSFLISIRKGRS